MSKHTADNLTRPVLDMDKWNAIEVALERATAMELCASALAEHQAMSLGGRRFGRDQGREERVFIAGELEKIRIDAAKRFGLNKSD